MSSDTIFSEVFRGAKARWLFFFFLDLFKKNEIKFEEVENIFINQGPGKFSGIRISISIAKAICIAKNINLFGFSSKDLDNGNYNKIIELYKKNLLIKDLINPLYLS